MASLPTIPQVSVKIPQGAMASVFSPFESDGGKITIYALLLLLSGVMHYFGNANADALFGFALSGISHVMGANTRQPTVTVLRTGENNPT